MLALGMVLMRRPKLLLLDEPSAGLAPSLVKEMVGRIREVREHLGVSILLVEQNIREAVEVSDVAYLLCDGRVIGREEEPRKLLQAGELDRIFFGQPREAGDRSGLSL